MQKRTTTSMVALVALVALVLGTIMPASVTAAPSVAAASGPNTEMAKRVFSEVVDCDEPGTGRVGGAVVSIYKEITMWNNSTTWVVLRWVKNATATATGVWEAFLKEMNYTFRASHPDWLADGSGLDEERILGDDMNKSTGDYKASQVCLVAKPLVSGNVKEQGTGQSLNAHLTVVFEDRGETLTSDRTLVKNGMFSFRAEPGTYTLTARFACHFDASVKITVLPAAKAKTANAGTLELAKIGDPCVNLYGQVQDAGNNKQAIKGQGLVSAFDDESHFTSNSTVTPTQFYNLQVTEGRAKLTATAKGYFDAEMWVDIPEDEPNMRINIVMTPTGAATFEISGWVLGPGPAPVPGARVDLYDDRGTVDPQGICTTCYTAFAIADAGGMYKFMVYGSAGNFSLIGSKDGRLNNSPMTVAGGGNRLNQNITLGALPGAAKLQGTIFSRDAKGVPVPLAGARTTLYDSQHLKTFTNVSFGLGAMDFADLYAGTFFLSIDHPQHQSNGTVVTLNNGDTGSVEVILEKHGRDTYNTSYSFARNASKNSNLFNVSNFMLYRNVTLEHDNVTVRAALDLSFGRGAYGYVMNDWNISQGEYDQWLLYRQPKWVGDAKSEGFFTVNKTSYDRKATSPITAVNNTGSVLRRTPMMFMVDMNFNTTKLKNGTSYDLLTNTTYDTFTVNYTGLVQVPENYERTSTNSPFELRNHTRVVVDSPDGSGRAEVKFTFQSSGVPTPVAKIWAWNDGTHTAERGGYVKPSTDGKVFFVANATKLIFSGEDSKDAIGAILKYKWDFNGTQNRTTDWITNNTNPHYYNETASNLTANNNLTAYLWVMNRGIKTNATNVSVIIDYVDPKAIANATADKDVHVYNGTTPGMPWKIVWANETKSIAFNASFSEDKTTTDNTTKDYNGTIRTYKWDWNDNITNKKNASNPQDGSTLSHAFAVNGTYNVTLNITDVVGHWTVTNMTIVVNDTTKPNVFVEMWELKSLNYTADKNVTDAKQGKENSTYSFRVGKNSKDPNFGTIVKWNWMVATPANKIIVNTSGQIENPVNATEWSKVPWLNQSFDQTGVWTVSMNMTDASDNWKNETFRVTIAQQARPDLVFNTPSGAKEKLNFSKPLDQIRASESLEIRANLSNNKGVGGAANATSVKVKLFINDVDTGKVWETALMKSPVKDPVYANVSIVWDVPWDTSGVKRIKLVAEASGDNGGEHPTAKEDSKVEREISIKPPVWIETGLPVLGVAIAIILIGLYVAWRQKRWIFSEEARTLKKLEKEKRARDEEDEEKDREKSKDKGATKKKDEKAEDEEE